MKDRIRIVMESTHMTQKTFAEHIGMSQAALSSIFNGRTNPTLKTVEAIINKMPEISLEWLLFGKGEMYDSANSNDDPSIDKPMLPVESLEFDFEKPTGTDNLHVKTPPKTISVDNTPKNTSKIEVKTLDNTHRRITEIRVFFDDRTFESFIPKE